MVDESARPTRKVRPAEGSYVARRTAAPPPRGGYLENWGHVVQGIVELKVDEVHEEIMEELRKGRTGRMPTGSDLVRSFDRVAELYVNAVKLSSRARAEYEVFKEDHLKWLEAKKTAARSALEEEKAEKQLKKQITIDMIADQVRATWPAEYEQRVEALKNFQAAVHSLEALPDALKMRARALSDQKDILLATGTTGSGR